MSSISALFTDLYELTMARAYVEEGMTGEAVFSLFVRRLPPGRNYLLASGLDTVLDFLENARFDQEDIDYLASLKKFPDGFLRWLAGFRFSGTVHAVREGTPVFANEPILEVMAPLPEAQVAETFILNQVHVQTVLASKAQRIVSAAEGRPVVDFGCRRMHGIDAAMKGARAYHIAGVAATSNLLAGRKLGIPVSGTMAHSYIQAHGDEAAAFRAFSAVYPETILLVDTYDTLEGVRRVIQLAESLGEDFHVRGVRLDSGDLGELARDARRMLDEAGLHKLQVLASGGLDEHAIGKLVASGAPIDGFGVGTHMGVSADAPDLDIVYKLCEYGGEGRTKLSTGKPILPGRKQVLRHEEDGTALRDTIASWDEEVPGRPLLEPVMRGGERLPAGRVALDESRSHARREVARLPAHVRAVSPADPPYPVAVSPGLEASHQQVQEKVRREGGSGGSR